MEFVICECQSCIAAAMVACGPPGEAAICWGCSWCPETQPSRLGVELAIRITSMIESDVRDFAERANRWPEVAHRIREITSR